MIKVGYERMFRMNVSLTAKLEELVQKKVKSGMYNSASEVIREALRILEERDALRVLQFKKLQQAISAGISEADEGKLISGQKVFQNIRSHHSKSHA